MAESIKNELKAVAMVANRACRQDLDLASDGVVMMKNFIDTLRDYPLQDVPIEFKKAESIEIESHLAMIYALTPRSKLYLNVLFENAIAPSFVLLLVGDDGQSQKETQDITASLHAMGIKTHSIVSKDINAQEVYEYIKALPHSYMIYSGYGGGILEPKYFSLGKHFIHIHAGKVPKYKGSTTCYYSLLEQAEITASAMFLNASLDGGDVLGYYSLDRAALRGFKNTDIDTTLEPYIRAKALASVLLQYKSTGSFMPLSQGNKKGETYYRIHPTLKHLALFSCFGGDK